MLWRTTVAAPSSESCPQVAAWRSHANQYLLLGHVGAVRLPFSFPSDKPLSGPTGACFSTATGCSRLAQLGSEIIVPLREAFISSQVCEVCPSTYATPALEQLTRLLLAIFHWNLRLRKLQLLSTGMAHKLPVGTILSGNFQVQPPVGHLVGCGHRQILSLEGTRRSHMRLVGWITWDRGCAMAQVGTECSPCSV